jgi:diguanylate cyclase (GGDEF)-like protein
MHFRVLVADDDQLMRQLVAKTLRRAGYLVELASDGEEAWSALQRRDAPELAILDWDMPGMKGPDLCRRVRNDSEARYRYLLLLSATDGREEVAEALHMGADDYVIKPFHPRELVERVGAGVRILDLQRRLEAAHKELRDRATKDALTSVWNRGAILELFAAELARGQRSGEPVSVAMVDIDHFKAINDTHGHRFGDCVLRELAGSMRSALRPYDEVGRYGGEEFLVVLPGCDVASAEAVAERIRGVVQQTVFDTDFVATYSVSIGVAGTGCGANDPRSLIHAADLALYRAKAKGRNRVEVATRVEGVAPSHRRLQAVRVG